ncbi:MAG TPA: hypothetical protein VK459_19925 [Polyangiaceae bacterium]|nr:hypothetical protein [Polyangiaceae bacterium]
MNTHRTWAVLAGALLLVTAGCASSSSTSSDTATSASSSAAPASVCTPGMDQTCNDDPAISSLHGTCLADGTCECKDPFEKNEATGRCK